MVDTNLNWGYTRVLIGSCRFGGVIAVLVTYCCSSDGGASKQDLTGIRGFSWQSGECFYTDFWNSAAASVQLGSLNRVFYIQ